MTNPSVPADDITLPAMPELSYLGDDNSYGYEACDMAEYARDAVKLDRASPSRAAVPVPLLNFAVWDDGELRLLSGRKGPSFDCELYAMPDGKRAPALYAAASQPATVNSAR